MGGSVFSHLVSGGYPIMARQVNQVLWDQWRRRMERQHASGLSIAEFCRRENIPRQGFHVWKRKLRHTASDRQASGEAARVQRSRKRRRIVATRRRSAHRAGQIRGADMPDKLPATADDGGTTGALDRIGVGRRHHPSPAPAEPRGVDHRVALASRRTPGVALRREWSCLAFLRRSESLSMRSRRT